MFHIWSAGVLSYPLARNVFTKSWATWAVPLFIIISSVSFAQNTQFEQISLDDQSEELAQLKPVDVRLVIDVSGSMKRNDPNNLRQPAVDLLLQLLPGDAKAGVWTFGQWVNMLVPHREVNDGWKQQAREAAQKINSVGLYTNIGEALEKAAYDSANGTKTHRTSIILLTDGMVDISKDPAENKAEWRRIVDDVLPKLKAAGYTIHTVGLSDNADIDLLNKLALSTDGIAAIAHTADELMKIFLKAFDAAAPAEQVPLSDNSFVVDSSVEEFTALIFRKNAAEKTELIGPDETVYTPDTVSRYINWYRSPKYDLVTIKQPIEGEWQVKADMDPDSRITVVSNLNLRVKPLPLNVFKDDQLDLSYLLQEDGSTIKRADFLSLMDIEAEVLAGNDEFDLKTFWKEQYDTSSPPNDGIFKQRMAKFSKDGIYQLTLTVDGKSFVREFSHQFTVREPFGADIRQNFSEGNIEYILTANAYSNDVDFGQTQVVATLYSPDGRKTIKPLKPTGLDSWNTKIIPEQEGKYRAVIKIKGQTNSGSPINVQLEDVEFSYSITQGFVEEEEPFFEPEPEVVATASPLPEEEKKTEASPVATEKDKVDDGVTEEEPVQKDSISPLIMYSVLGIGNLLLFAIGFFAYKKIMGGPKPEDILEEFSESNVEGSDEKEKEAEPEDEADEELEDEEPPMEDLEPMEEEEPPLESLDDGLDDELDEPSEPDEPLDLADEQDDSDIQEEEEASSEIDMDDDMEMPSMDDISEDLPNIDDDINDEEDPIAELSGLDDAAQEDEPGAEDGLDDIDDLDAMSEPPSDQEIEDELAQEDEEEDMVSAMLKAQGLDLAEEELDDAISSLIDDLDRDDIDLDDYKDP